MTTLLVFTGGAVGILSASPQRVLIFLRLRVSRSLHSAGIFAPWCTLKSRRDRWPRARVLGREQSAQGAKYKKHARVGALDILCFVGKGPLGRRHLVSMFHIVCTVLNPTPRRLDRSSPPITADLYLVPALFNLGEMADWEVLRTWRRDNKQIGSLVRGQDNAPAVASAVQETAHKQRGQHQ